MSDRRDPAAEAVDSASIAAAGVRRRNILGQLARNPAAVFGFVVLLFMLIVGSVASQLGTIDPARIDPGARNKKPGAVVMLRQDDGGTVRHVAHMGTDSLGRDVYSRTIYGARVSLAVGAMVALISVVVGVTIGL
ncbi:MAG: ABC transporter permease, partial [Alphaproteobacteria bacterium]|nr:ABC transporter permease [Alphaproteobacteria bacterium]